MKNTAEEHYNTFSDKVIEILTELESKRINKYKAKLTIWINSRHEINR